MYIGERSRIYIYQYPDKLVRAFGKKGEGPGEFREYFDQGLMVSLYKGNLCVESNRRVYQLLEDIDEEIWQLHITEIPVN